MTHRAALVMLLAVLLAGPRAAGAQDSLTTARNLYASAAYDEALTLLDRLQQAAPVSPDTVKSIAQYRILCLFALSRVPEAERAVEQLVAADPLFQLSGVDLSPRVQALFKQVRRRVLPGLIRTRYADAKTAFQAKQYGAARQQFTDVLALLNDPTLADLGEDATLADVRTLATDFLDLARAAATPPAPAPGLVADRPAVAEVPPAASAPAPAPSTGRAPAPSASAPTPSPSAPPPSAPPPATATAAIYGESDADVTRPTPISQEFPAWPVGAGALATFKASGLLEVVIDERGLVESAVLRRKTNALYDRRLVDAARTWRYQPATRDGRPVKYRKLIQVAFGVQ